MIEVVPAILAPTQEVFAHDLARVRETGAPWVHIDVCDGDFVASTTWQDPVAIMRLCAGMSVEVHLMVADAAAHAHAWQSAGAHRIIVHVESHGVRPALAHLHTAHRLAGVALRPETAIQSLEQFLTLAQSFLVLGVHPGAQGKGMLAETAARVAAVHALAPMHVCSVDGGVNTQTLSSAIAAGARRVVCGSAILHAQDPHASYEALLTQAAQTLLQ